MTPKQAAEKLGIGNMKTFYNLKGKGTLRQATVHIPGLGAKFREDVLDQMIEQNTLEPLEVSSGRHL